MIEVHNIGHGFARKGNERDLLPVLENISFTIPDGQIVSLLGPSGCGKTTLLRIIDGLIQPLVGEIRIDGVTVRKPDTGRAMVFQEFNLLPWRTALRNIEFARALGTNPKVLLMDEPFGALDPQIREVMQIDMLKLLEAEGKIIVLVTHSIDEAIFLSDTVVVFSANPGRVLRSVNVDLPRPR